MFAVLLAIVVGAVFIVILMAVSAGSKKANNNKTSKTSKKSKSAIARDCVKKLAKDPHNVQALTTLSDIYYNSQEYEKALPLYETLSSLASVHVEIDQVQVLTKAGICAFKTNSFEKAYNSLSGAVRLDPRNFDANYYLGRILKEKNEYEKAIVCFKRALTIRPDATNIYQYLGSALYNNKQYRDSLGYLRKSLDENPSDKETLFTFASALEECNMGDKALKIFMHLRPDPVYGAQACLACGAIHQKTNQIDKALEDYSIALKLDNVSQENRITASYKMALIYLSQKKISNALTILNRIQSVSPGYKDVNTLISRYQEMNQNSNLQAYLMSGTSDFVALCRKFVACYHSDSHVRIEDITVNADNVEVLCDVESSRWSQTELFRFFRNSGAIGELYIRDFHSKIRDMKCDRGFCVTAGTFTEEARKYVENRPIDLIEKSKLSQILKKIH